MARPKSERVLLPLTVRLPEETIRTLDQYANANNISRSDCFRRFIDLAGIKETSLPTPGKVKKCSIVYEVEPQLKAVWNGIGRDLNQIAQAAITSRLQGEHIDLVSLLATLESIEYMISACHEHQLDLTRQAQRRIPK